MLLKILIAHTLAIVGNADVVMTNPVPYGRSSLAGRPLRVNGDDFPCQLRQGVYNHEGAENIYAQGSTQHLAFTGSAVHGGGSCQVSVTTDLQPNKDSIWKVIKSVEGGCPAKDQPGNMGGGSTSALPDTYDFGIPMELAAGNYTLAWTWFPRRGSQDMYMNCAPLTVIEPGGSASEDGSGNSNNSGGSTVSGGSTGSGDSTGSSTSTGPGNTTSSGGSGSSGSSGSSGGPGGSSSSGGSSDSGGSGGSGVPVSFFDSLPSMFVANLHNGSTCRTVVDRNVLFPNPGVFVEKFNPHDPFALPVSCGSPAPKTPPSSIILQPIEPKLTLTPINRSVLPRRMARLLRLLTTSTPPTAPSAPAGLISHPAPDAAFPVGASCTNEGGLNCIDGGSLQRCTKGTWSSITPLALGVECIAGQSSEAHLVASRRSKHALRDILRGIPDV